jgi:arylsulfatase A-like enzyme
MATLCHNVEKLDGHVGEILGALANAGLADNTIVVFTTDHGPAMARAKHTLYDAGIRTSLVMRYPGTIQPATDYSHLLSNLDLLPTLMDMAGLPLPSDIHGRSFSDLFLGRPLASRPEVYSMYTWARRSHQLCRRSIRTDRYKLIRNFDESPYYLDTGWLSRFSDNLNVVTRWPHFGNPAPALELYDLDADPWEQTNLAAGPDHADVCGDLNDRLAAFLEETGDLVLEGRVPNVTGEVEKQQWVKEADGVYRLDYDVETETRERPF